jgi:[acyl-carrier-protein] S-malonyltransferase
MNQTALLFAGQGAQHVGMGSDWADRFPTARTLTERARQILGYDLAAVCFRGPEAELTQTEHAQPGIFLVSWMAFTLLREQFPAFAFQAAAGLSLGEFTALAAAGAMTFEDGLKVVAHRGRFMQEACEATRGSMAAIIGLDVEPTRAVCDEAGVELANLNCPGQLVISGELDRISRACELAKAKGAKRALPLTVAGAYHSRLMAGAQPKLERILDETVLASPGVPVIANVTAQPHGAAAEIRRRLVDQVTASVRWEESMRLLLDRGYRRFIELGPGTTLSGFLKRIDKQAAVFNVSDLASLEKTAQALKE